MTTVELVHSCLLGLMSLIMLGAVPWAFIMGGRLSKIEQAVTDDRRRFTRHSETLTSQGRQIQENTVAIAGLGATE